MIEQCLSNKNESATVAKNPNFCQLNKALIQASATYVMNEAFQASSSSTCVGRTDDKGWLGDWRLEQCSRWQQQRSALGETASHGGGATQPGNSRWRWRCYAFTHQGDHGREHRPVVANGNGNCLSCAAPPPMSPRSRSSSMLVLF